MYYVIHCRKPIYADLTVETIYLPEEKYLCWLDWRYNVFTVGKVFLLTCFRERRTSPIWWPWYRHRPGKPIWLRGNENHQNPLEQETTESRTHYHHPYGEVSSKSRVEICRDRHNRQLCKICSRCVNFPRKQRVFSHNLRRTTKFTHANCDFALKLLKIYTLS